VRARIAIAIAAVLGGAVAAAAVLAADGEPVVEPTETEGEAAAAAERFLDGYVEEDGRVARHDQDGTTVAEGQAYAMLLALAIGDEERFDRVWSWTRENLQGPDGLLASLWAGGRIADSDAAADADLDAARALVLAGSRFDAREYTAEGVAIAEAILANETAASEGRPVLVAGPWARTAPPLFNPSYFDPRTFADLAAATDDPRWRELAESSRDLVAELTAQPPALPPDWARVEGGTAVASAAPSAPEEEPRYGFDAVRVPTRLAASCASDDRELAAGVWRLLSASGVEPAAEHALDGSPLNADSHPAALVGAAAAAGAAGDATARAELLDRAAASDESAPSYYGAAWVALGRVMLTTDWLGAC
jgi:endoglucanase